MFLGNDKHRCYSIYRHPKLQYAGLIQRSWSCGSYWFYENYLRIQGYPLWKFEIIYTEFDHVFYDCREEIHLRNYEKKQ